MPFSAWPASFTELNASYHGRSCVTNMMPCTAATISANAAGPPQWHAAPPLTAWTSMSATRARVARGSPRMTGWPAALLTVTEYFGGALGVPASRDLSGRGDREGASTTFMRDVSAAIGIGWIENRSVQKHNPLTLKTVAQKGRTKFENGSAGAHPRSVRGARAFGRFGIQTTQVAAGMEFILCQASEGLVMPRLHLALGSHNSTRLPSGSVIQAKRP